MKPSKQELEQWRQWAEEGHPPAQISLAWEYVLGECVEKNLDQAFCLLRKAELKEPSLARFYLAKAKLFNGDRTLVEDLAVDCAAGFGPALYLMAVAAERGMLGENGDDQAIKALAAERGHLVAEFFLWREQRKSLVQRVVTFPSAVRLFREDTHCRVQEPR